jgi:integral membrane protein (TIGR00529 family)
MIDMIKLALIFLGIVIAIQRKLFIGYILLVAGLATAIIYETQPTEILFGYGEMLKSSNFLRILGIILMITFLGKILKDIGYLDRLVWASHGLIGGARAAVALLPLAVGLMPMPGGALLSAPLVGRILAKDKFSPELATSINYWSRHIIEFWWPIYPGVILAAAITGLPIKEMALMQFPLTLVMAPIGYFFMIRKVNIESEGHAQLLTPMYNILRGIWPIILAIGLYALLPIDLLTAIAIAIILLIIIERPGISILGPAVKKALAPKMLVLVFGIMSFQKMLEISGAVGQIPSVSAQLGLPSGAVIFTVAFVSGLLTGMLAGLVGLSFPILAGFLYQPELNLNNIFFAFISGYVGMMLSPTHFCLILTNEYFKSNLAGVYKILIIPLFLLFLVGFLLYLTAYPWHISL